MLSWLLILLPLPVLGALDKTHGVSPYLLPSYVPIKSASAEHRWRCLDGSKEIPWDAVNDDFCDCPDGSDEPGTSACPNSTFYCVNEGHIGTAIRSSRVRDSLCEPECCDGSDEAHGVCRNVCREIGQEYKEKVETELKTRKTGAKIRSTYIAFAKKEQQRLEKVVSTTAEEVAFREKEVFRLKDILDRTESLSAAALELKKQSPLYKTLIEHSDALKYLRLQHKKLQEKEKTLADILASLRRGYNPNYQDMAVLEAVRGYEYYAGLPHINDAEREEGSDGDEVEAVQADDDEALEEETWNGGSLDSHLDALLTTDYVNLLLEQDGKARESAAKSLLFDLSSYIPNPWIPQYEQLRDALLSWLEALGVTRPVRDDGADTSKARSDHQAAESALRRSQREHNSAKEELDQLFDPDWFGNEGEWKKLSGTCLQKDTGEYTYEVCLFGEAKQKSNKGGANISLGKFASWNASPNVKMGTPEFYSKQIYTAGLRCWNGPARSVILHMVCGTENALLTVSEPEKCEYMFTGTTPALCYPLDGDKVVKASREDL